MCENFCRPWRCGGNLFGERGDNVQGRCSNACIINTLYILYST